MCRLKTGRHFEKIHSYTAAPPAGAEELAGRTIVTVSHSVSGVELCLDSRFLLVAGCSGQVTLFQFVKTETCHEVTVILSITIFS